MTQLPHRPLRRCLATAIAFVAAVLALLISGPPQAQAVGDAPVATAPSARYARQATTDSSPVDLPGAALTLQMTTGEGIWLYTTGLEASTAYGSDFPDPGVTFIVQCYGPGIAAEGTGWYAARNLDPPHNTYTFRPQIRAMFVAPSSGTYVCKIRIAAYQPRSGSIEVVFKAGAVLHGTPVKPTSTVGVTAGYGWTVPNSGSNPQPTISASRPTLRHLSGSYTFARPSSPKVTVTIDQNVTTCSVGDTFPGCGTDPQFDQTTVRAKILAQPQHLDGTPCGVASPLTVFTHDLPVKAAYHHYPILTTAVLDKAIDLRGCPRVNLVLELTWLSGQPMVVHTFRPHDQRPGWGGIYEHG